MKKSDIVIHAGTITGKNATYTTKTMYHKKTDSTICGGEGVGREKSNLKFVLFRQMKTKLCKRIQTTKTCKSSKYLYRSNKVKANYFWPDIQGYQVTWAETTYVKLDLKNQCLVII
uniref:Uncharacterized protein n=1 Tax=Arion vulgaris TaxID=1028688 RepID=A0A0B7BFX6_9EUPU